MRKLLLLIPFTMLACNKDEKRVDDQLQLLLQAEWVHTLTVFHWVSLADPAAVPSDSFVQKDCVLDDRLIFKSDKTMKSHRGPIKCFPDETQVA